MRVEIWSDVVCPWCAIGRAHLEAALEGFDRSAVEIHWRSYELDPRAPRSLPHALADHLARKYGTSQTQALAMMDRVTEVGRRAGLDFHFERARTGNTFDAHRLLHLAAERGHQEALKARFFRGYLEEGAAIGEPAELARMAVEVGLDAAEVDAVLAGTAYADAVRADERLAAELGVRGVPFFVFDGRLALSGAQPVEVFTQVLAQAGTTPRPAEACDDTGCAIP